MATPVPTKEFLAEDHSSRLINVVIVFIILEVLFLVLFCISRYKAGTIKGIDTYLMIPAFIANVGMVVLGLRKTFSFYVQQFVAKLALFSLCEAWRPGAAYGGAIIWSNCYSTQTTAFYVLNPCGRYQSTEARHSLVLSSSLYHAKLPIRHVFYRTHNCRNCSHPFRCADGNVQAIRL